MTTIAVLGHSEHPPLTKLQVIAHRFDWHLHIARVPLGEPLPNLDHIDGLIILGAPVSTYQAQSLDWLQTELKYVEQALKRNIPIFGICFGCQMLAQLHGGEVYMGKQGFEFGYSRMTLATPEADPIFGKGMNGLDAFQAHGDTYTLPKTATRLLEGPFYPEQAAKFAPKVYGTQFHPEVTPDVVRRWHQFRLDNNRGIPAHIPQTAQEHADFAGRHQAKVFFWLERFLARLFN